MAKIAIVYYSMYGHIRTLINKAAEGARKTGAQVDIYQVAETLPQEVLTKMYAPPKDENHPIITPDKLKDYDGFIFGIPTRYGRAVHQIDAFLDQTGGLWMTQALSTKFATVIASTGTQHGGQETVPLTTVPYFAHHGLIYVPLGYADKRIMTMDEVTGGSPYGASTLANADGSRQPSENEKGIAEFHGEHFAKVVNTYVKGKSA